MTEEHDVRCELAEVRRLNDRITEIWTERELPPGLDVAVCLAFEEVLSNVIRHGAEPGDSLEVHVRFTAEGDAFSFEVFDNGRPFNPLEEQTLDPSATLNQRRAGGMGLLLVKNLADDLRYEFKDGFNRFYFRKQLTAA